MTSDEFKSIRQGLGLTLWEMGLALGYRGNRNTLTVGINRLESGKRTISRSIECRALKLHYKPKELRK